MIELNNNHRNYRENYFRILNLKDKESRILLNKPQKVHVSSVKQYHIIHLRNSF
jgi:hypothetical protein